MATKKLIQLEFDKFQQTASGDVAVRTISVIPTAVFGQLKMTGSAIQLPNALANNGVILQAKTTNAGNLLIGNSAVTTTEDGSGNGYILEPGFQITFAADNLNQLYVRGTSGDVVSYAGS